MRREQDKVFEEKLKKEREAMAQEQRALLHRLQQFERAAEQNKHDGRNEIRPKQATIQTLTNQIERCLKNEMQALRQGRKEEEAREREKREAFEKRRKSLSGNLSQIESNGHGGDESE